MEEATAVVVVDMVETVVETAAEAVVVVDMEEEMVIVIAVIVKDGAVVIPTGKPFFSLFCLVDVI